MDKQAQLHQMKQAVETRRAELFALKEPIDAELTKTYQSLEKINNEIGKLVVAQMESEGVSWVDFTKGRDLGMILYRFYDKVLHTYHAMSNGIWNDTHERSVQFCFYKKEEPLKQAELIGILTPLYTPNADGYVRYGIMSKDLSASGVLQLYVKADLSAAYISKTTYGSERAVTHANPLDITLARLCQDYYYAKRYES